MAIPVFPEIEADALEAGALKDIKVLRSFSKSTSISEAANNRVMTAEDYLTRYQRGGYRALRELLTVGRGFQHDPRVAEALAQLVLDEDFLHQRRGHPVGLTLEVLFRRVAIARVIEGARQHLGMRPEAILEKMADRNFEGLTYSGLKQYYYWARRHAMQRPHLFTREDQRRIVRRRGRLPPEGCFRVTHIRIEPPELVPPGCRAVIRQERRNGHLTLEITLNRN